LNWYPTSNNKAIRTSRDDASSITIHPSPFTSYYSHVSRRTSTLARASDYYNYTTSNSNSNTKTISLLNPRSLPNVRLYPPLLTPLTSTVHTILGKKANRSSSLSQVVNYFDSSPISEQSTAFLDSPLHLTETTPKHTSFYNPRGASESDTDSEDEYLRDQSPEFADDNGIRSKTRSLKSYIAPKRWPDRLKGSGSSSLGTGGSNSTTSLSGQQESTGRPSSPELVPSNTVRASVSDIGSEDLPMRKLSVSRNDNENRTLSPFVWSRF
jgi:hypothetical protein